MIQITLPNIVVYIVTIGITIRAIDIIILYSKGWIKTLTTKRKFKYDDVVSYIGAKYFFKELRDDKALIANGKDVTAEYYNDWWVDVKLLTKIQ
jgi:hypothetical protein